MQETLDQAEDLKEEVFPLFATKITEKDDEGLLEARVDVGDKADVLALHSLCHLQELGEDFLGSGLFWKR